MAQLVEFKRIYIKLRAGPENQPGAACHPRALRSFKTEPEIVPLAGDSRREGSALNFCNFVDDANNLRIIQKQLIDGGPSRHHAFDQPSDTRFKNRRPSGVRLFVEYERTGPRPIGLRGTENGKALSSARGSCRENESAW